MMRTVELLERQHREVLAKLEEVEQALTAGLRGDEIAQFADFLDAEVGHHFVLEEDALFRVLARRLSLTQGPLAVMNSEHAEFRELVERLRRAVRAIDVSYQRLYAGEIIMLLRSHIAKEDHVLFPMALRLLSAAEQQEVDAHASALDRSLAAGQLQ
jgi:hemerythrin-like domain-containing protein